MALNAPGQTEGWLLFVPSRRGTTGGLGILDTPTRKKRDVPLAKGRNVFLAPEMHKLQGVLGSKPTILEARCLSEGSTLYIVFHLRDPLRTAGQMVTESVISRNIGFLVVYTWLLVWCSCLAPHASAQASATSGSANRAFGPYDSPVHLADLEYQPIKESSGIAASRHNPNLFWTHNDSGDGPFIYAFDRRGKHRGVWRVRGATAVDWEDMAIGPGPDRGKSYLYLGDIGNNLKTREEMIVYRVVEPLISSTDSASSQQNPRSTQQADVIRFRYPDGKHDSEALLVHPSTADLYIVTKVSGEAAGVYKAKAPLSKSSVILEPVGEIRFPNPLVGVITGGDISPDGRRIILCDYLEAFELVLSDKPGVAFDTIWKEPLIPVDIGARQQGEAVCYSADGLALFATSEELPCPLIEVKRRMPGR